MSSIAARSSQRLVAQSNSSTATQRLAQVGRHFSSSTAVRKEIQDAYILSAARTPTTKVHISSLTLQTNNIHQVS